MIELSHSSSNWRRWPEVVNELRTRRGLSEMAYTPALVGAGT